MDELEGRTRFVAAGVAVLTLALSSLSSLSSSVFAQAPQSGTTAPPAFKVEVIGTTPLPGVELLLDEIPAPAQTALQREIEASGALDLSDFLNRRLNGVFVNETQGNPFQPDINYRGYSASPLLGTPQGLSVYMDGVRLNQPFGEVVSWDLIPRLAIASTTLMPGSNPLFGLNTLGGALSIQTKDGRSNPGTSVQAIAGSHVRRAIEFEHGGSNAAGLHWFAGGNLFGEHGWRDHSPTDVLQLFGKVGVKRARTDFSVTAAHADNSLTGNGLQDRQFVDRDYASVYTWPDETGNRSTLLNVTARHNHSDTLSFSGNGYYRHIQTRTFNGDVNEDSLDQSVYQPNAAEQAALAAAGYTGFPASGATAANTPLPFWRCIGNVLLRAEPGRTCNGLLNRTNTGQDNYGVAGQLTLQRRAAGRRNQLTVGAAYDGSRVDFAQSTELGYLNPDRSVAGTGAFGDGVTGGSVDGAPYDTRVDLNGRIRTLSLYAADMWSIGAAWHLTAAGRFNRSSIRNTDAITPGGGQGSLDADDVFSRFNPALGITFSPSRTVNLYAGYGEGSRAPASIELGCADPRQPCKLPNAMAGDPPLDQVVTRTLEGGVRGGQGGTSWNAGVFRAENRDDILFVSSSQTGFGYFTNFGKTRRQGLELGIRHQAKRATLGAGYTYLDATYQSAETFNGTSNSANDAAIAGARGLEGTIHVGPGDRVPLVPRHMLKVYADLQATSRLSVDVDVVAASSSLARGNENNAHQPDGTYYLGPGTAPGYGVVNLGARYRATRWLQVIAQVNNLFDRHYFTVAQLGPAGFTADGTFIAQPFPAVGGEFPVRQTTFFAPGAPTTFWVGTRVKF